MRILIPFNKAATYASFYTDFHAGLVHGLRELGHEALIFEHEDIVASSPAEQQALYKLLMEHPADAVFDLCCWAHCLSQGRVWDGTSEGEPVFDSIEADYVGLLFDHPWFQPLPAVQSSRLYASVGDQANIGQIGLVYPALNLRGSVFAPPAIGPSSDHSRPGAVRDIPLLYIGNLHRDALTRLWRDADDATLFDDTADLALAEPDTPLDAVLARVAAAHGRQFDTTLALEVLRPVEYYRRTRVRQAAVHAAAAAGAPMHVVGDGWAEENLPAHVTLHPFVSYESLLDLAARAQICLDASTYPQGANDRVFNYMANGALCFTNARGHLATVYGPQDGLQFYSTREPQALAAAIGELLATPARLAEQAGRARARTLATQTWRHRVQAILGMLGEGT